MIVSISKRLSSLTCMQMIQHAPCIIQRASHLSEDEYNSICLPSVVGCTAPKIEF